MNNKDDNKKPWSANMQAAMKELEKFYRTSKASDYLYYCPLCRSHRTCDSCPWKRITGYTCAEMPASYKFRSIGLIKFSIEMLKANNLRITKSHLIHLRRRRARELKQWMKHYEEER
jgi:hypothetical protein